MVICELHKQHFKKCPHLPPPPLQELKVTLPKLRCIFVARGEGSSLEKIFFILRSTYSTYSKYAYQWPDIFMNNVIQELLNNDDFNSSKKVTLNMSIFLAPIFLKSKIEAGRLSRNNLY